MNKQEKSNDRHQGADPAYEVHMGQQLDHKLSSKKKNTTRNKAKIITILILRQHDILDERNKNTSVIAWLNVLANK